MPNRNSNIGPPRTAVGSFGLPAKPDGDGAAGHLAQAVADALGSGDAFAGGDGVLDAWQLLEEAPPVAMTSASLATSPAVVWTVRPSVAGR